MTKRLLFEDYLKMISKEALFEEYITNNSSGEACAEKFNVPISTLYRILKYYNISKPKELHTLNIKKSKKEHFGDENYNNKNKRAETNIVKYGVDNQWKRQDLMEEVRAKNVEKYGSKNNIYKNLQTRALNSGSIEESYKNQIVKTRQTVLEKYGVDWQLKQILLKIASESH